MKTNRLAALALFVAGVVALGGCGKQNDVVGGGGGPSPSASPVAPRDALVNAARMLTGTSYAVTVTVNGLSGDGKVDPLGKNLSLTMSGTQDGTKVSIGMVKVGADSWMKLDMGSEFNAAMKIDPNTWLHVDTAKLGNALALGDTSNEPMQLTQLLDGLVDAQWVDATHMKGTFDLTKATGTSAPGAEELKKAGDKAKAVPFTAAFDDKSRLVSLKVDGSAIDPSMTIEAAYRDYGVPVNITKPSGKIVEAPSTVYEVFGD